MGSFLVPTNIHPDVCAMGLNPETERIKGSFILSVSLFTKVEVIQ
jgi:hypothetical protein